MSVQPATSRWMSSETGSNAWHDIVRQSEVAADPDWDRALSPLHDAFWPHTWPSLIFLLLHRSSNTVKRTIQSTHISTSTFWKLGLTPSGRPPTVQLIIILTSLVDALWPLDQWRWQSYTTQAKTKTKTSRLQGPVQSQSSRLQWRQYIRIYSISYFRTVKSEFKD